MKSPVSRVCNGSAERLKHASGVKISADPVDSHIGFSEGFLSAPIASMLGYPASYSLSTEGTRMLLAMAVTVSVLASGSRGNSTLVQSSATRLLIDAGLSCRETFRRMRTLVDSGRSSHDDGTRESDPRLLSAILITHEHSDHVAGLLVLARKLDIPVYMTEATHQAWKRAVRDAAKGVDPAKLELKRLEIFTSGQRFSVGDIDVTPFTIPHDAVDPVGFTLRTEGIKIGIATDLGYMPASICEHLRGCDVLMMESNHDIEMLRVGPYPWSVKQRVMSRVGHLSNSALADFLAKDYDGGAAFVVLAHLSEQNNHPELARAAAEKALGKRGTLLWNRLLMASQAAPMAAIRL